jgi:hypothetical protein
VRPFSLFKRLNGARFLRLHFQLFRTSDETTCGVPRLINSRPPHAVVLVARTAPIPRHPMLPGHAGYLMKCGTGFVEYRSRILFIDHYDAPPLPAAPALRD